MTFFTGTGVPNPQEVANVAIDGYEYDNWDSVMVQHRWMEAFPMFMVGVVEGSQSDVAGPVNQFPSIQFNVGDLVTVTLGGVQAIYGPITERQSAEDARSHGVRLIGKGLSWQMTKSSIYPTWNFDNQDIVSIANAICGPVGVGVTVVGQPDMTPFPRLQASPGEPSFDFLDQVCRKRSTILASDEFGNLVLAGQNNTNQDAGTFVEGYNIKRINCIWSNDTLYNSYFGVQQGYSNDQTWGIPASQQFASAGGSDPFTSNLVIPSEIADPQSELYKRLQFEQQIHEGTRLKVTMTVQGWFNPNTGDIWRVGSNYVYTVDAPTHLLNNAQLCAQTITFTQDEENGTLTTLELVLPQFINGELFAQNSLPQVTPPASTPFGQIPD